MPPLPLQPNWSRSAARRSLLALYAQTDAELEGWTCACSHGHNHAPETPRCCHFAVTGREPYPTAIELHEVRYAMRNAGVRASERRRLPMSDGRRCPLLSDEGRCRVYASRPFGCRTFFCHDAQGPLGSAAKRHRQAIHAIGRAIADLSAQFDPRDPLPRALTKALG